ISTRIGPRGVASQVLRSGGTPPKSHGMMPFLKRSSQNCGLEESDAKQDERDEHHDEERGQQVVAPRILGSESLYREPQRAARIAASNWSMRVDAGTQPASRCAWATRR